MKRIAYISLTLLLVSGSLLGMGHHAVSLPLSDVLKQIEERYEVVFSYNTRDVKDISIRFDWRNNESFEQAVNRALENTNLKYKPVGLNFYVIYVDNQLNEKKLQKIQKKIQEIRNLGDEDSFIISDNKSLSTRYSPLSKRKIKGQVTSKDAEALIGATVRVAGTTEGTITDSEGRFELDGRSGGTRLVVSYTGYKSKEIDIINEAWIDITLEGGMELESVTVFGSRGAARSRFDSPVPIDHIDIEALDVTGAISLDQQLARVLPSFNIGQHPVSDASAHINAADLRGLLPSRTLVLVNGKRKNPSPLLYTYVTASRGEVGVDFQSIGSAAVQTVEILRDGASAQYGSDAIAGVINLQLKDRIEPFFDAGYGITSAMDGAQMHAAGGYTATLPRDGFATITMGYKHQQRSQRAGTIYSAQAEADHWGTEIFSIEDYASYLDRHPSAGFEVGIPDMSTINAAINAGMTLNKVTDTQLYAFGTWMKRSGRSPQFARTPYWISDFQLIYPGEDYFLPEMAPEISDKTLTMGVEHTWRAWHMDVSSTYGGSRMDYHIINSYNQSLGADSPKDFYNGAHSFSQLVNNFDIKKTFKTSHLRAFTLSMGLEQRLESFKGHVGEFASYGDGTPDKLDRIGSESFSGISPEDAVQGKRNNIGFYAEANADLHQRLRWGAAARIEHYSDFGINRSWKMNALYKVIPDRLNLRSAVSSGFRAPALHQIYYTSTTTTLTPQGIVQNRILNNQDPSLDILRIPRLMPETSLNVGGGFTFKINDKIDICLDAYKIDVRDRIVLSGQIGRQSDLQSLVNDFLDHTETNSAGFFLNAVHTTTRGIDFVFNLHNQRLGSGTLSTSLAANINATQVTAINLPDFIEGHQLKDAVFSREDISRLETWRPRQKIMLSGTYAIDKLSTTVSINHLGGVTYRHPINPEDDATYSPKTITSISMSYDLHPNIQWTCGVHNLFNIYPDTFHEAYDGAPHDGAVDFVGRFEYPWRTIQLGIDGVRIFSSISFHM